MRLPLLSPVVFVPILVACSLIAGEARAQTPLGESGGFLAALHDGDGSVDFRYRFEYVDQDGLEEQALVSTLRTALRYQTLQYRHTDLFLEMTNVADLGSGPYNLPGGTAVKYPVVADPLLSRVNQAFLRWSHGNGALKGGRQELVYDNARFVGNVGWRQNHQVFDSFRADWTFAGRLDLRYTYIGQVHRITGGELELYGHLGHARFDLNRLGSLSAYALLLDFNDATSLSTNSFGGFWDGSHALNEGPWTFSWRGEYAVQQDGYDNTMKIDANYMHFMGAFGQDRLAATAGFEQLSGSPADGQFNTVFATAHKFNGWADKFLATPPTASRTCTSASAARGSALAIRPPGTSSTPRAAAWPTAPRSTHSSATRPPGTSSSRSRARCTPGTRRPRRGLWPRM